MQKFPKLDSKSLYQRLLELAIKCQAMISKLPKNLSNIEYGRQLIRSSGSIGANYLEAIEGFSKKEFIHRLKICRKEARETIHWLNLIRETNNNDLTSTFDDLLTEGKEIIRIFSSSVATSERNSKIIKSTK